MTERSLVIGPMDSLSNQQLQVKKREREQPSTSNLTGSESITMNRVTNLLSLSAGILIGFLGLIAFGPESGSA
jgi:hypothetical protein